MVFEDRDADGARDPGEPGLPRIAVSNGSEVVRSDASGRYRLPLAGRGVVFVIKPRDWMTPVDGDGLPRFYYLHEPAGSPAGLAFLGVEPTGPLPASLDFPLFRRPEPDVFQVIVLADPQPHDLQELDWLRRDIVEELVGHDAAFGITLGDIVDNDLALFEPVNRALARIGVPWYNVHGNHDMNFRAADDEHADASFRRVYGPATYAFQYGPVHFVVLDDVIYDGVTPDGLPGGYHGGLRPDQLAFVRNYLALVPASERVVLAMHIPLARPGGKRLAQTRELLEILSSHPLSLSLSGHAHIQFAIRLGPEDGYAPGDHLHLNVAAASGSWWFGAQDEVGIPHATMSCGSPNGYSLLSFDGRDVRARFKAARRPADYQMNIFAPAEVAASEASTAEVLVNVFAGSSDSSVEMRLGDGAWIPLEPSERRDPFYAELWEREAAADPPPRRLLPPPQVSPHLWSGRLPANPQAGTFVLEVRTRDPHGSVFRAQRLIRFR